jgi:hypothetical protein
MRCRRLADAIAEHSSGVAAVTYEHRIPTPARLVSPSSLLDGLGRGRRVKAKPADAGRLASLDTAATAKGRKL